MSVETLETHQPQELTPAKPWHALDVSEAVLRLETDVSEGLSSSEASRRQALYGPNSIRTETETQWYTVLGRQFVDVLILILLIAAIISFSVGELTDALTILAIVVLNGLLGFVQEWKAERALAALKHMLSPQCRVIRNGDEQQVEATTLVPGDVVLLEIGDRVPADLRLVESLNLKVDESALTGESFSVGKQITAVDEKAQLAGRNSMVWAGTAITNGRALGVTIATGANTEFGRIAALTQNIGAETTPLQRKLAGLGKQLGLLAVGVSCLVASAGALMGKSLMEMFMTGVSLAVAVVPEGLPAVVTLTMALGIRAMVRRRALLRRLQAAEGLGAATVICTDKTGTLTQNQMTVQHIWMPTGNVELTGVGYDPAGHFEANGERLNYHERPDLLRILESSLICNHARLTKDPQGWHETGEPTEAALVVAAYKAWLDPSERSYPIEEFSFNSDRKRMTVVVRNGDALQAHVKGAPEVLLPLCSQLFDGNDVRPLTNEDRKAITQAYTNLAEQGLRTLAVASRELPTNSSLWVSFITT